MSVIRKNEDGVKQAIVLGPTGVYQVYQTANDDGDIVVYGGQVGAQPMADRILGAHQEAEANELFDKLVHAFGPGKATNINLDDYVKTDPSAVEEEDNDADGSEE